MKLTKKQRECIRLQRERDRDQWDLLKGHHLHIEESGVAWYANKEWHIRNHHPRSKEK